MTASNRRIRREAYRQRVANLAREIEEEAAAARKRTGTQPLGRATILAQDPVSRPKRLKKSPAPLFHAATKAMRRHLWEGYAWFVAAYRTAAEKLQRGDPEPGFPRGSFPPAMPFVSGSALPVAAREFLASRGEVCPDGRILLEFRKLTSQILA